MIFYHYTARDRLAAIMSSGLSIGDVPLDQASQGLNGVWLTTDRNPLGHGLGEAREMTDDEREAIRRWKGELPPQGYRWANKREIRITVKLPNSDRHLKHWLRWSQGQVDPAFREALINRGGGKQKAKTWYIYFGTISSTLFQEIVDLEERSETQ